MWHSLAWQSCRQVTEGPGFRDALGLGLQQQQQQQQQLQCVSWLLLNNS